MAYDLAFFRRFREGRREELHAAGAGNEDTSVFFRGVGKDAHFRGGGARGCLRAGDVQRKLPRSQIAVGEHAERRGGDAGGERQVIRGVEEGGELPHARFARAGEPHVFAVVELRRGKGIRTAEVPQIRAVQGDAEIVRLPPHERAEDAVAEGQPLVPPRDTVFKREFHKKFSAKIIP